MTELQRLELRSSEIRSRLNELAGIDDWSEEQRSENDRLAKEYGDVESRRRTAILLQDDNIEQTVPLADRVDPEGRELRSMLAQASVGRIVGGVVERRAADGVERELQQHYGLSDDAIPLAMLAPPATEQRADAVTSAPADVGANQQPIIPAIFPMSASSFIGVDMPTVPVGEQVYTYIADGTVANAPDKGDPVDSVAATLTAHTIEPGRLQVEHEFALEDKARLMGMSEALRRNLSDALMASLDEKVIAGLLATPETGGLPAGTPPGAVATYAAFRSAVSHQVDGRYAGEGRDVRVLIGEGAYQLADATYRSDSATDESAIEAMRRISGGVRVSDHIPDQDDTSNIEFGIAARALGATHAVCPMWEGVRIIYDPYTKSENGLERLVAIMLYGFQLIRPAGFARLQFQLS